MWKDLQIQTICFKTPLTAYFKHLMLYQENGPHCSLTQILAEGALAESTEAHLVESFSDQKSAMFLSVIFIYGLVTTDDGCYCSLASGSKHDLNSRLNAHLTLDE